MHDHFQKRISRFVTRGDSGEARWEEGIDGGLVKRLRDASYLPSRDEVIQILPEYRLEYRYEFGESELLCEEFINALGEALLFLEVKEKKILEIGAGSGRLAFFLSQKLGEDIVAIDSFRSEIPVCFPVEEIDVLEAYRYYQPKVLLISWPPEDMDWRRIPDSVEIVVLIGDPSECGFDSVWPIFPGFSMASLPSVERFQESVSKNSTVVVQKKSNL